MQTKPFWEQTYADDAVSTFFRGATQDVWTFHTLFPPHAQVPDVGCGEGRNALFLAGLGHQADAFDISENGIAKAGRLAAQQGVTVNFQCCDMADFVFEKAYDVILSHGVLHLPHRTVRDAFLLQMQAHTRAGGYHVIGVFTDRLPAVPDLAPFTHSLFAVGELPQKYRGWQLIHHQEGTFTDTHPGDIQHRHAFERIIARRPV